MAPGKKMTMAAFERSATDKRMDRAGAKKAGKTLKQYEGSAADRKADRQALAKINGSGTKAKGRQAKGR